MIRVEFMGPVWYTKALKMELSILICLVKYGQWICGTFDLHIPFSLLEVHHRMRHKAPMSCTGTCTYTCGLQIVPMAIDSIDCLVIVVGRLLGEIGCQFSTEM